MCYLIPLRIKLTGNIPLLFKVIYMLGTQGTKGTKSLHIAYTLLAPSIEHLSMVELL